MNALLDQAFPALGDSVQSVWAALASRRDGDEAPRRILFASPRHGDGTTTLAACTALSLCRNLGVRVALVEANGFAPALAAYAGCAASPGLAEVLRDETTCEQALQEFSEPGLQLLPWGTSSPEAPADWRGARARALFREELRAFPFTLLDAPPLLDRPGGRLLLESCDGAVLVFRAGSTSKPDARATLQVLRDTGVPLAGVVLNRFRSPFSFF